MASMEQGNLHEFIYGSESANKLKKFEDGLKEIEKKYPSFFKERKARLFTEEHDKIQFHYVMKFDAHQISFFFLEASDLPDCIKKEGINLFNSIYN